MNSIRPLAILAAAGLLAAGLGAAQTRADAEKDPVLKAMLAEMDRSKSQLQLPGFDKPFFIQYRIEDVDDFETRAEFGATTESQRTRQRVARVIVRVGDYKTDSSGGRADSALELAALDDDPIAIRSALWAATDQAYKGALAALAQKQAALKQVETPPQADDFSHETPVIHLEAPQRLHLDEAVWAGRVAHVSGLYRDDASVKADAQAVQSSSGDFHARATTTWLVSSEGAIVRKSATELQQSLSVSTQAADGMRLDLSHATVGATTDDLDPQDAFEKHSAGIISTLMELRRAPLVEEEYHGPLLLAAGAGAHVFHALLAGPFAATRPRLGTDARTSGPFASSFHARVLPTSLDVVDDPSLKSFAGKALLGAYQVDDEGIPAQAVKLVTAGRLENYLIGREPVRDFPQSNGHGRAGITSATRPGIGVLTITAHDGLSDDELNHRLLAMAQDRGLKNVYYVASLGGSIAPRLIYRVTPDGSATGKRDLVRGAALEDLDLRALRSNVEAAGKELRVANYFGDVPETVLAPALLLDDITVKRASRKNDKLPYYPPPE